MVHVLQNCKFFAEIFLQRKECGSLACERADLAAGDTFKPAAASSIKDVRKMLNRYLKLVCFWIKRCMKDDYF